MTMNFVYLGYDKFDAATNMAIDEAALNAAERYQKSFIRFYDFDRPAVILSHRESKDDIDIAKCRELGVDISRRLSHGSVILCDTNVLAYSIASPFYTPDSAHSYFARRIAGVLKDAGVENVGIGNHFSVRINGGTVAGHGQRWKMGRSLLYHGVMAVEPWNTELINAVIKLRPPHSEGAKSEYELVGELPAVAHYVKIDKKTIASRMLESVTDGQYETHHVSELYPEAGHLHRSKYTNDSWIYDGIADNEKSHIMGGLGFCFIDIISPEGSVELV